MINRFKFPALLLLAFVTSFSAGAKPYFDSKIISPTLIDKPIAVDSKEWQEEIEKIVDLQKDPNEKELQKAQSEHKIRTELVMQTVEPKLTREKYPQTYNLLDRVFETSRTVNNTVKEYWHTERPYLASKKVKSLLRDPSKNPAYPSGHTSYAFTQAYVLSLLIPGQQDKFYQRAKEIAEHRILVGMHYPHDIQAGRQLALLIVGALVNDKNFQKDFAAAKAELSHFVDYF